MEVVRQVTVMSLLIIVGFVLRRTKILAENDTKVLSNIVVYVANPASVFFAYQLEYSAERMHRLGYSLVIALIIYLLAIIVATLLIRNKDKGREAIERISVVLTNCGFMGIPLIRGVYGDEGVFFLASFIAVNNIVAWTYGIGKISGNLNRKSLLKILNSPTIYAIIAGILVYILQMPIPSIPLQAVEMLAGLTTPTAMIVAGATMSGMNFKKMVKNKRMYLVTAIKLLVIPCLAYFVLLLLPRDTLIMQVQLAACACPTATLCTILALKYDKDSVYTAELFTSTTILSMVTLPLIMQLPF